MDWHLVIALITLGLAILIAFGKIIFDYSKLKAEVHQMREERIEDRKLEKEYRALDKEYKEKVLTAIGELGNTMGRMQEARAIQGDPVARCEVHQRYFSGELKELEFSLKAEIKDVETRINKDLDGLGLALRVIRGDDSPKVKVSDSGMHNLASIIKDKLKND